MSCVYAEAEWKSTVSPTRCSAAAVTERKDSLNRKVRIWNPRQAHRYSWAWLCQCCPVSGVELFHPAALKQALAHIEDVHGHKSS